VVVGEAEAPELAQRRFHLLLLSLNPQTRTKSNRNRLQVMIRRSGEKGRLSSLLFLPSWSWDFGETKKKMKNSKSVVGESAKAFMAEEAN
jgi:hypothetical protein